MFRRHIIQLGSTGVFVIYDELEGKGGRHMELPFTYCRITDGNTGTDR